MEECRRYVDLDGTSNKTPDSSSSTQPIHTSPQLPQTTILASQDYTHIRGPTAATGAIPKIAKKLNDIDVDTKMTDETPQNEPLSLDAASGKLFVSYLFAYKY